MDMIDTQKKEAESVQMMDSQSIQTRGIGPRSIDRKPTLSVWNADGSLYSLRVIQQPERARLCSFKEENETSKSLFSASASGKKRGSPC